MMRHAWGGYVAHAWGSNELDPVGKKGHKGNMPSGMGVTIVDSLDTLYIMGLDQEFDKGKEKSMKLPNKKKINRKKGMN